MEYQTGTQNQSIGNSSNSKVMLPTGFEPVPSGIYVNFFYFLFFAVIVFYDSTLSKYNSKA